MEIEKTTQILIYIHAILGAIALIAGGIALSIKKGNTIHKKAGKVFFYTMLLSALIALFIAVMPRHESPFLFSIGLFSSYFIISGYRSLRFKQPSVDLKFDKLLAYFIILTGSVMIVYPIIFEGNPNIVLLVFGIVGLIFGIRDILHFRDKAQLRKKWLPSHLGKMTGGYIAAVTAFFVVNQFLPGVWNWFVPGVIGSAYIAYWTRKVTK